MILTKCKICGQDIFKDFKRHTIQRARYEVWQKSIGSLKKTPHFDYYFKNTKRRIETAREWI